MVRIFWWLLVVPAFCANQSSAVHRATQQAHDYLLSLSEVSAKTESVVLDGDPKNLSFSPSGEYIVTSTVDGGIKWGPTGLQIYAWKTNANVVVHDDGSVLYADKHSGNLRKFRRDGGNYSEIKIKKPSSSVSRIEVDRQNTRIAVGFDDGSIRVYHILSMDYVELEGAPSSILSLGFSPNGSKLVSGDSSGNLNVWEIDSERLLGSMSLPSSQDNHASSIHLWIKLAGFSDENSVVAASPATLVNFNWATNSYSLKNDFFSLTMCLDKNAKLIFIAHQNGLIDIFDIEHGIKIKTLSTKSTISSMALSGNGFLTIGLSNKKITSYSLKKILDQHDFIVNGLIRS